MNYIIFDLEATCWRGYPPNGVQEIIEIGAVKVDQYGKVVDTFDAFVRPIVNTKLSSFCKKLTSITQEQVDTANTYDIVLESFHDWIDLEEDFFLCAWGDWDGKMLAIDCKLHDQDTDWLSNYSDLKKSYQKALKLKEPRGLKNAIRHEGMEFTGIQHRAISDAENTAKIFIKYFEELGRSLG